MITAIRCFFYLRKSKVNARGTVPIYARVTIDGKRFEFATSRTVQPADWVQATSRVVSVNSKLMDEVNSHLDVLKARVLSVERRLLIQETPITIENFEAEWFGGKQRSIMLLQVFEEHNGKVWDLIGHTHTFSTWKRYKTSFRHTRSFIKDKYNLHDIDVTKIHFSFITDYDFWLRVTRNCGHNSTIKYLTNFRKIINICLKNGWINKDPFAGFKMTKLEVERAILSKEEIDVIAHKSIENERLSTVRDIFIFCCYTGLAYADVESLSQMQLFPGIDGGLWIYTHRKKTDVSARIPLLPTAQQIIEIYRDHPECVERNRVLPVPSNQKFNSYLKELAAICGIRKYLTSHMARHTFATTITLTNGVPIESVSKMLGHRTIRTTQLYAKVLDVKVSEDMNNLRVRLETQG